MEHALKFKQSNKAFLHKGEVYSMKQIGNFIREGHYVKVESELGTDITKKILIKIALEHFAVDNPAPNGPTISDVLELIVSEDTMLDIIEDGGITSLMAKKARGVPTCL